ncbi:MAG: hypothetical protein LUD48_05515, partial [Prevotella sp.]|nr:hypothetical protein [Prevotella sp.]
MFAACDLEDAVCDHDWIISTTATCAQDGVVTYTCTKCGATKTKKEKATGLHTWEVTNTKNETCGEDGEIDYTCNVCGATKTEVIPATGDHSWDEGEVTTAATCAAEGVMTYTCSVCGETKEEVIPVTGDHSWYEVSTTATCTTDGEATYTCSVCGETKTEEAHATGHSWSAGTDNDDGTITYTCSDCSATKTGYLSVSASYADTGNDTAYISTIVFFADYTYEVTTYADSVKDGSAKDSGTWTVYNNALTLTSSDNAIGGTESTGEGDDAVTADIKSVTASVSSAGGTDYIITLKLADGSLDFTYSYSADDLSNVPQTKVLVEKTSETDTSFTTVDLVLWSDYSFTVYDGMASGRWSVDEDGALTLTLSDDSEGIMITNQDSTAGTVTFGLLDGGYVTEFVTFTLLSSELASLSASSVADVIVECLAASTTVLSYPIHLTFYYGGTVEVVASSLS